MNHDRDEEYVTSLVRHAHRLTAFDHGDLAEDGDEELAAGALASAVVIVVDELFEDLKELELREERNRVKGVGITHRRLTLNDVDPVWSQWLPERLRGKMAVQFLRRMITTATVVGWKLTNGEPWGPLSSLAEELVLHGMIERAKISLDSAGALTDSMYASLYDLAFEDTDFLELYQPDMDGIEDTDPATRDPLVFYGTDFRIANWFEAFNPERHPSPYGRRDE